LQLGLKPGLAARSALVRALDEAVTGPRQSRTRQNRGVFTFNTTVLFDRTPVNLLAPAVGGCRFFLVTLDIVNCSSKAAKFAQPSGCKSKKCAAQAKHKDFIEALQCAEDC
jgi:hypothetical protein